MVRRVDPDPIIAPLPSYPRPLYPDISHLATWPSLLIFLSLAPGRHYSALFSTVHHPSHLHLIPHTPAYTHSFSDLSSYSFSVCHCISLFRIFLSPPLSHRPLSPSFIHTYTHHTHTYTAYIHPPVLDYAPHTPTPPTSSSPHHFTVHDHKSRSQSTATFKLDFYACLILPTYTLLRRLPALLCAHAHSAHPRIPAPKPHTFLPVISPNLESHPPTTQLNKYPNTFLPRPLPQCLEHAP